MDGVSYYCGDSTEGIDIPAFYLTIFVWVHCIYYGCWGGESIMVVSEFNELDGDGWWWSDWGLANEGFHIYL